MRFGSTVVMLFLLGATHIQSQEKTDFGETLEVRIINLEVVVRDKAGQLVTGLTADDFVVYEKGKPQPITNFAEYREAAPKAPQLTATGPQEVETKPPQKRHLVFISRSRAGERSPTPSRSSCAARAIEPSSRSSTTWTRRSDTPRSFST